MEKAEHDLIVVGAGPAGSACAITATRAGIKVLLLDEDCFPRHKVCGEFVSPESLQLLEWLLNGDRFQKQPRVGRARVFSGRSQTAFLISPPARSIPRFDLDAALLDAARQAGAQVLENVTVQEVVENNVFQVKSKDKSFTARAVVNASGRWSQLSRPTPVKDSVKWIGFKGHFRESKPLDSVDLYFFAGGYCGVQPVSNNAINACAMVRADTARSLDEAFALHPELWRRSRDWEPLFTPISTSALYFRPPQTESQGMLLAGDAAAFIDPFAGDGISLALHTGTLAAKSLLPFVHGDCSLEQARHKYRSTYLKHFSPAFRNAALVRKMLSASAPVRALLVWLVGLGPFARVLVRSTRAKT